jgi:phytol kinase
MNPLPVQFDLGRIVAFVLATVLVWLAAGWLRQTGRLRAGDARKLSHIGALAGGALWFGWLPEAEARGSFLAAGGILFVILLAACVLRHVPGCATIFAGYARPSDGPEAGRYVWLPWLLAVYGLGLVDALFRDWSLTRTAALVLGVGDGLGEPIGSRFGRLRYPVLGLFGAEGRTRTVEGSLAVFVGSLAVLLVFGSCSLGLAVGAALAATLAEALSPRGTDNFFVPVATGAVLYGFGG